MSKNLVFKGQKPAIAMPVPAGTRSGDPVRVGGINGVCDTDRVETVDDVAYGASTGNPAGYASVAPDGVYSLKVPEVVSAPFTPIYIVEADNSLTTDDDTGANPLFGHTQPVIVRGVATGATKAVDSGGVEGVVNVRIYEG